MIKTKGITVQNRPLRTLPILTRVQLEKMIVKLPRPKVISRPTFKPGRRIFSDKALERLFA